MAETHFAAENYTGQASRRRVGLIGSIVLAMTLAGCGVGESSSGTDPLVIDGTYNDNFGCVQTITSSTWTTSTSSSCGGIFHIAFYSNEFEYLAAQNDPSNSFDASLWSRFDWVTAQGHLYYCQTAFSAATEAAALATARSDDSDPGASGCGGAFEWTQLN